MFVIWNGVVIMQAMRRFQFFRASIKAFGCAEHALHCMHAWSSRRQIFLREWFGSRKAYGGRNEDGLWRNEEKMSSLSLSFDYGNDECIHKPHHAFAWGCLLTWGNACPHNSIFLSLSPIPLLGGGEMVKFIGVVLFQLLLPWFDASQSSLAIWKQCRSFGKERKRGMGRGRHPLIVSSTSAIFL